MAHTCQRVGDDVRGHKSGQRKEEEVYERPEGTGAVDGDDSRHTDANVRCLAADAGASAEFQEDGAILIAPIASYVSARMQLLRPSLRPHSSP